MYTAIAGILFSLVLTLFSVRASVAEVWMCPQPNGSTLYTDQPQGERSCEKFEPTSQVILLPPRIDPSLPADDPTSEEQEAVEADAPWRAIDEQTVVASDAAERYNAHPDTFWDWDDNPVFVYTYVTRPYGFPFLRHKHTRDFSDKPWNQKQQGIQHKIPLFRQSVSPNPSKHFRENSAHAVAPTALPQYVSPIPPKHFAEKLARSGAKAAQEQSVSPASSTHVPGGSLGAAAAPVPAPSSGFSPHMRR